MNENLFLLDQTRNLVTIYITFTLVTLDHKKRGLLIEARFTKKFPHQNSVNKRDGHARKRAKKPMSMCRKRKKKAYPPDYFLVSGLTITFLESEVCHV